jgi:hypothetical protein
LLIWTRPILSFEASDAWGVDISVPHEVLPDAWEQSCTNAAGRRLFRYR